MRNIKLTIQYDGTNYSGWQSQKNSVAIQDIIEKAASKVLSERIKIIGAGRTDAGVHAKGQVANLRTESRLSCANIKNGLNRNLPSDIVISKVEEVHRDFHSQYDAKGKLYRYSLYTHNPVPPFCRDYVTPVKYRLDLEAMKKEAKGLLGRHDFSAFQGANSKRANTTKNLYRLDIKKKGCLVYIDIEANGFLYNMARSIVGTLLDVGRGRFKAGCVKKILKKRDRRLAGSTAPARGLSLLKVRH